MITECKCDHRKSFFLFNAKHALKCKKLDFDCNGVEIQWSFPKFLVQLLLV